MKNNFNKPVHIPKLKIWFFSTSAACIIISTLYVISPDPILIYLNYQRINNSNVARDDSVPEKHNVIIIGSSLSLHAIYYDDVMEQLAKKKGYDNYSFTRFVLVKAHLSQYFPLFDFVLAAKPDIILFQSTFLAYQKPYAEHHKREHDYHRLFKKYFLYKIGIRNDFSRYLPNREAYPNITPENIKNWQNKYQTPAGMKEHIRRNSTWSLRKIHEIPQQLDRFLKQAVAANISVIILDLPRPEETKSSLPGTEEELRQLMADYKETYQVEFLEYPYKLYLNSFLDFNHLAPPAKKAYSLWLIKQLEGYRN